MFWFKRWRPLFSDGVIDLVPIDLYPPDEEMGLAKYTIISLPRTA